MRVGIDISPIIFDRGVSRYTQNLVRSLLEYTAVELSAYGSSFRQYNRLLERAQSLTQRTARPNALDIHIQKYPPSVLELLWKMGLNPVRKQLPKIEVFHSWDWLQPPDKNLSLVSTIHDLAILKYPETAHPKILAAHQQSWKILQERQAEIIAVSQATKRDIVNLLGIPAFRIHVIPEALPQEMRRLNEQMTEERADQIKEQYSLNRPYLLFVGTREPRKNLKRLIEAWDSMHREIDLIIAGATGWDDTENSAYAAKPGLRFLGKVSDEVLNILYAEAEAFVFPSIDEGFGLPILEAFYHGTPVVTSNVPALIEVAGNAAELVEPEDSVDIARGIRKILSEDPQAQRQRLQRMIIRMHMFGWHLVAEQTVEVYKKALTHYE